MTDHTEPKDVYTRVTERIIADLEKGVRAWMKPWHAEHAAGRIDRPLRNNGTPYRGINILLLWAEAMLKGYAAPIWMTYKQAQELKANTRWPKELRNFEAKPLPTHPAVSQTAQYPHSAQFFRARRAVNGGFRLDVLTTPNCV